MTMSRSRRIQLEVETMESRTLLAGNVLASVVNGDLMIKGDNLGNAIRIWAIGANQYRVIPVNASIYGPTTINGTTEYVANGVTRDISVKMLGGDDFVHLLDGNSPRLVAPRNVKLDMGAGNDTAWVDQVQINGKLKVLGGDGNDQMPIVSSLIKGATTIDAGKGDDALYLNGSEFDGGVTATMGDGRDVVVDGTNAGGGQPGAVFKGKVQITLGKGDDIVSAVTSRFLKSLSISGNAGNDTVNASLSEFDGPIIVDGGGGTDTLNFMLASNTILHKPKVSNFETVKT
jgi:hypothetical protein